jgi:hypothetical protein
MDQAASFTCDVDKIQKGKCPKNEHPISIVSPESGDSLIAGNLVNITWNGGLQTGTVFLLFRYIYDYNFVRLLNVDGNLLEYGILSLTIFPTIKGTID